MRTHAAQPSVFVAPARWFVKQPLARRRVHNNGSARRARSNHLSRSTRHQGQCVTAGEKRAKGLGGKDGAVSCAGASARVQRQPVT